jgi:hypothetical protein
MWDCIKLIFLDCAAKIYINPKTTKQECLLYADFAYFNTAYFGVP